MRFCLERENRGKALEKKWLLMVLAVCAVLIGGCTQTPYHRGHDFDDSKVLKLESGKAQIERGEPHALLEGIGH